MVVCFGWLSFLGGLFRFFFFCSIRISHLYLRRHDAARVTGHTESFGLCRTQGMGWKELGKDRTGEYPRTHPYTEQEGELEGSEHWAQMFSACSPSLWLQGCRTENNKEKNIGGSSPRPLREQEGVGVRRVQEHGILCQLEKYRVSLKLRRSWQPEGY